MKKALGRLWGIVCLLAVGALCFCAAWDGARSVALSIAAEDWEEVPCVLHRLASQEHHGRRGRHYYTLEMQYAYAYAGQAYAGTRYDFWERRFGEKGVDEEAKRLIAAADSLTCFVNPADPREAFFERGILWRMFVFYTCIPAVVFVLCFWGLIRQCRVGARWARRRG